MSTQQTDSFWARQQEVVQNFAEILSSDIVQAEKELEELNEDPDIHPVTRRACGDLLTQLLIDGPQQSREDYLINLNKHN